MSTTPTRTVEITRGEARVLHELMRDGAGNRQIARRLSIAEDTVKTHLRHLLEKTGCETRTGLTVALFRGLVTVAVPMKKELAKPPINHGTAGGYRVHIFRDDEPCLPCQEAVAEQARHMREVAANRKAAA